MQMLQESEGRYRGLAENSADWVWAMDREGRHTYCNQVGLDVLGTSAEEFLLVDPASRVHPDDRKLLRLTFECAVAAAQGWRGVVIRWRIADGGYRAFESNASPIFDAAGELVGFQGVDRDVTERMQTEVELERNTAGTSRTWFRSARRSSPKQRRPPKPPTSPRALSSPT
jgi:PAS domain S-box-containing protein